MSKPKSTGYMFLLYCNETPKGVSFDKNKQKLKLILKLIFQKTDTHMYKQKKV